MIKSNIQTLQQLEESLWKAETRFDRDYMDKILSPDFFECGRSGKVYTREQTIATEPQEISAILPLKNFQVHTVSDDVVLVTYESEIRYTKIEKANRSSLWKREGDDWKLCFHQGTPLH